MFPVRQAVIMVGGKGTRLYPLTINRPKPALPVLDRPCLKYLIGNMAAAGLKQIYLACGFRSDLLRETIGDGSDLGVEIIYSDEETPLGTGGAMKLLEDRLDETFVAANGDALLDIDVYSQIQEHFRTDAQVTIALTSVDNPCEFGIARVVEDGRILEFKDKPRSDEVFSNYINAGVYVVQKKVLGRVPKNTFYDFSKDLVPILAKEGERIQSFPLKGAWRDVGRPADLIGANVFMADRLYADHEWNGLDDSKIIKPFYLGKGSVLKGSHATGSVILDGCFVSNCNISDSLILKGSVVKGATVENSILGENCIIHEGAVIRDCVLSDGTEVSEGTEVISKRE
ncbi:MAG: NDP-sugar synthase [archaeon]|nr:NDP-sugar synthase [archaeon]